MSRSLTFVADGDVKTLITVTENGDGTLSFDIKVVGDTIGDLRAIFFDLNGLTVAEGDLYVTDAVDVAEGGVVSGEEGVDRVSKDANIKGSVSNELGDFDVGIEFGTSGIAADDIQSTSFTLASYSTDLTLDMLSFADFGLRYTSVGLDGSERTASAKIGDTSGGTAQDDTVSLAENTTATVDLLANDAALGTVTARTVTLETAAGIFGTVVIGADGIATIDANGPAADALGVGETASFVVEYTVTNGDDVATAMLTVTIEGEADGPPLFTDGADTIDFNAIVAGTYQDGTQYDALDGNDTIFMAADAAAAAAAGFDPTQAFHAGAGNDRIFGGALDETVYGGEGNDQYVDGAGNDTYYGGGGVDRVTSGDGGNDHFVDGDVLSWWLATGGMVLDIANGTATGAVGSDTFANWVRYETTDFDDVIYCNPDTVQEWVFSRDGNDIIYGSTYHEIFMPGEGDDTVYGGGGIDRVDYGYGHQAATVGVTADLLSGVATGQGTDTLIDIDQLFGSAFDDTFYGNDDGNALYGRGGNDVLYGRGGRDGLQGFEGDDQLYGGDGDDFLVGGTGNDLIDGGAGFDTVNFGVFNAFSPVVVDLGAGTAVKDGFTDTILNVEVVIGSRGNDVITGDAGDNQLEGLFGDDVLTGGAGVDTFFFLDRNTSNGADTITDFTAGEDIIRLSGYTQAEVSTAQVGTDVLIDIVDGTSITVQNALLAEVEAALAI